MKQKVLLLCLLSSFLFYGNAKANESEPNDTRAQANTLALNGSNSGKIDPAGDQDWWKVTTNADGKLNITLTPLSGKYLWINIYDNNGTTLLTQNNGNSQFTVSPDGLTAGTYYVQIVAYYSTDTGSYTISSSLTVATPANDVEPNNTKAQAKVLPLNGSKTGHVNYYYNLKRDSVDWYKVTIPQDGKLTLKLTSGNGKWIWAYLFDNDGTTQLNANNTNGIVYINSDGLAAGTYYVRINSYYDYPNNNYTGDNFETYTLMDSLYTPNQANDDEPNDSVPIANTLAVNSTTTGHVNYYYNHNRDDNDWYKITIPQDGKLTLKLTSGNGKWIWAYLFDHDGTTQLNADNTNSTKYINTDGLAAGTYYVRINSYYDYGNNNYTGDNFEPYTLTDSLYKPAEANDDEPNDDVTNANTLAVNSTTTGHVNYYYNHSRDANDWYKITIPEDGMLQLKLTSGDGKYVWAYLFDNDGTTQLNANNTNGTIYINTDGLAAGTYYVRINSYYDYGNNNYTGDNFEPYTLTDSLITYTYSSDEEPNKYAAQAKTLLANKSNGGHSGFYYNNARDTVDWYKINYTANNGNLTLNVDIEPWLLNGSMHNIWLQVYNDTAASPIYNNNFSSDQSINLTSLTKGYYYVKVFMYYNSEFTSYSIEPHFSQTKARISTVSYDTTSSCDSNWITYKLQGSNSPYTVQLYRFQEKYGNAKITNKINYTFSNLPDGIYYATVYGDGATGSAKGISDTITIMPTPTHTLAKFIKQTNVTLTWDSIPCADYFKIRYQVKNSGQWKYVKTDGNVSSYVLTNLMPGTTYQWQISAKDKENNIEISSALSATRNFTTKGGSILFADENAIPDDAIAGNNKGILNISPNPASSYFIIHFNSQVKDKMNASLFDVNGKSVWSLGSMNADALNGKQVMVNQMANGLYYLKISDSKGNIIAGAKVAVDK